MEKIVKEAIFNLLKKKDIAKAELDFSGGNDEGGVDDLRLYDEDHIQVSLVECTLKIVNNVSTYEVWENGQYRKATNDEIADSGLRELLEKPIYDRYGSFNGEFYVNGSLYWDVLKKTVTLIYDEAISVTNTHTVDL